MYGAHYVCFVGLNGDVVREADKRLGCQMEHNLGLILGEDFLHFLAIANVGTDVCLYLASNARQHEIVFLGIRFETDTNHFCSKFVKPD